MARQYVFLVHGMGEMDPNTWHEPFTTAIISALKQYEPYTAKPQEKIEEEDLHLIPITYDDVFSSYHSRWENLTGGVGDAVAAISPRVGEVFQALSKDVNDVGGWQKFFWTHVLDPLLWYLFEDAREAVVARVNKQIISGLKEMKDDGDAGSAHVLAHSLGTSVTHDSLVALRHWRRDEGVFKPGKHIWHTVGMLANVGRLLETTFTVYQDVDVKAFRVYESALKPAGADTVCRNYVNVHHVVDPFTWPRRFKPGDWPHHAYSDIEATRIRKLTQVHDFDHYFADPGVHLTLLSLILKRSDCMCTLDEVKRAYKKFNAEFPLCTSTKFDHLRDLFGGDPDKKLSPGELASFLFRALKEVRK